MEKLEKKIKNRYGIFILTIGLILLSVVFIIINGIGMQISDANTINLAGKQSVLGERIFNQVLKIEDLNNNLSSSQLKNLSILTNEFENIHNKLDVKNKEENNKQIDSLYQLMASSHNAIVIASKTISNNPDSLVLKSSIHTILSAEKPFQETMSLIMDTYEAEASKELRILKYILFGLAFATAVILIGEFYFIITPVFKELLEKNKKLVNSNIELTQSENLINKKILELSNLKTNLEVKEAYNRIFIEQAPMAIAMVDTNMCYLAVSQRWITDYKMEGQEFIGRSHYELFPEIGDDWKQMHQRCLRGEIDINDEEPFIRSDGSLQWLYWDVRPWYDSDGNIGGILMQTGDITNVKENEEDRIRIQKILNRTNEVARIGAWDIDLLKKQIFWSKVVRDIHEVSEDFEPNLETAINFFKEGKSREIIKKAVEEAINNGTPYDVEIELITSNNNIVWTRAIGQAKMINGTCVRIFGIFQDISEIKKSEGELLRKNKLLNFAEEITLMGNWQWDTVADEVKWSNNLYNIFQLDKNIDSIKFDTYFNFVHPDDKEMVSEYFKKAAEKSSLDKFTHRIIAGDGKLKIIQLLGEVIRDNSGNVIEMIGTGQDITEQKMAENKFRGLLESAPDAMVIVNESGTIDLINKQAVNLFGYTSKELKGKPVETLIPNELIKSHTNHRDDFFATPKTRLMGEGKDLYAINKKGEKIPIQISLGPLQTEEGLLVSVAIRDITNQKLAEQKILAAKENLENFSKKLIAQNTQLADFTHITSHNLRAPVSNLNTLLDFYKESESESEKLDLFNKFDTVIQHLTLTLNTLIEALQTKNDTVKQLEEIPFDKILNKTKEILTAEISKSAIIIQSDFSNIEKINYNKIYLESIFLNLVSNAIKYKAVNRTPELFIQSEIKNGKIELKFKDNGLGIDLKRHGHKLFGLNKVFHRHPDAKGVGLFMTKTQIEAMGGIISAESSVNEGTTFTINFN